MNKFKLSALCFSLCLAGQVSAETDESFLQKNEDTNQVCSSFALMTQIKNGQSYFRSVNLSTGEIVDEHSKEYTPYIRFNGMGFNPVDYHYYAMDQRSKELLKITITGEYVGDSGETDFEIERIAVDGLDEDTDVSLYVADISEDGYWYGFHNKKTLYKINLDPDADDAFEFKLVGVSSENVKSNLGDMAFNPIDGLLYGVTSGGFNAENKESRLVSIDPTTSEITDLGLLNVEEKGFFGAVYFDNEGNLFAANNKSGHSYHLNIPNIVSGGSVSENTMLFSNGFSAQGNDGARCSYAELIKENFDHGQAPEPVGGLSSLGLSYAKTRAYTSYYLGADLGGAS